MAKNDGTITEHWKEIASREDFFHYFASKHDLQDAVTAIKDEIRSAFHNHETRITKLEEHIQA